MCPKCGTEFGSKADLNHRPRATATVRRTLGLMLLKVLRVTVGLVLIAVGVWLVVSVEELLEVALIGLLITSVGLLLVFWRGRPPSTRKTH